MILLTALTMLVTSCTTSKQHNPNLLLHPDQYVVLENVKGNMLEVSIPEDNGKMTYYGWVESSRYLGWTLVKKTWAPIE